MAVTLADTGKCCPWRIENSRKSNLCDLSGAVKGHWKREVGREGERDPDPAGQKEHPPEQETGMQICEDSINGFPSPRAEISITLMETRAITAGRKDFRPTSCCFAHFTREVVQGRTQMRINLKISRVKFCSKMSLKGNYSQTCTFEAYRGCF